MGRTRTLEAKAADMIMQKIHESGEMKTDEIIDLIRPHYLFDPATAREQGVRRKAHQLAARIRDDKGIRSVFACDIDGMSVYVNIDESQDVNNLRSVEGQLNAKLLGLSSSMGKASLRRMEVEGQLKFDFDAKTVNGGDS